jgi:hypothetical protein
MLSTFFLLFNYHHNAVDNHTRMHHSMSDLTSLSIGRNTTAKALDRPTLDGTTSPPENPMMAQSLSNSEDAKPR